MARSWSIYIPVRPKAVQSVRGGSRGFFADKRTKEWKATIRPYIEGSCDGPPTSMPLIVTRLRYIFKYPQKTPEFIRRLIHNNVVIPCIGTADITDNLAKGLIDTCAGLVFVNDKQIWKTCDIEKVYGETDGILIEFMETPDVLLIDGSRADGAPASRLDIL